MEANNDSTGNEDPQDLTENALILVEQLHADKLVNDDERDSLKGKWQPKCS